MKVYLGSDHAGFKLKEQVKETLNSLKITYEDLSPQLIEGDDYPDHALKVCEKVKEKDSRGILFCGTGIGMSIAANKVPGIRAAICKNKEAAELSRSHNDSNVLVLSGWFEKQSDIRTILETWLNTEFEGGRHKRRLDKIKSIEEKYSG